MKKDYVYQDKGQFKLLQNATRIGNFMTADKGFVPIEQVLPEQRFAHQPIFRRPPEEIIPLLSGYYVKPSFKDQQVSSPEKHVFILVVPESDGGNQIVLPSSTKDKRKLLRKDIAPERTGYTRYRFNFLTGYQVIDADNSPDGTIEKALAIEDKILNSIPLTSDEMGIALHYFVCTDNLMVWDMGSTKKGWAFFCDQIVVIEDTQGGGGTIGGGGKVYRGRFTRKGTVLNNIQEVPISALPIRRAVVYKRIGDSQYPFGMITEEYELVRSFPPTITWHFIIKLYKATSIDGAWIFDSEYASTAGSEFGTAEYVVLGLVGMVNNNFYLIGQAYAGGQWKLLKNLQIVFASSNLFLSRWWFDLLKLVSFNNNLTLCKRVFGDYWIPMIPNSDTRFISTNNGNSWASVGGAFYNEFPLAIVEKGKVK